MIIWQNSYDKHASMQKENQNVPLVTNGIDMLVWSTFLKTSNIFLIYIALHTFSHFSSAV